MFLTEHVPVLFKKATLKLVPLGDGTFQRVCEATCLIEPFPYEFGAELGDEVLSHLFADKDTIRPELESIDLRVRVGRQNVEVWRHRDLDSIARLTDVSIKDVSVSVVEEKKGPRAWLSLSFVLAFSWSTREARNFILDEFGHTLELTFESVQARLEGLAEAKEALANMVGGENGATSVSFGVPGEKPVVITGDEARRLRREAGDLRKRAH